MFSRSVSRLARVSLAALLLVSPASALTQNGTVATVQWDNSPRLALWVGNSIHYAYGSAWGANCNPVSADTLKLWESMAQAALLAGKKLDIDYVTNTACVGSSIRIINAIRLQAN